MRVLVAEDEPLIADAVAEWLRREALAVDVAYDGEAALERLGVNEYDVLVLDRDLPGVHGDDVCRELNASGQLVRILMLTASGRLHDRISGLNLGADDYLAKPFAFEELLARVRARLRPGTGPPAAVLRAGSIWLNVLTREATSGGQTVTLSAQEFALLRALITHPGQTLSRQDLLSMAWNTDFDPQTNLVDVYIRYLRRKLGEPVIETVRGAGYRLRIQPC